MSAFVDVVMGASLVEVNPGLTFWTLITFLVVFIVLRWKAWGPILKLVEEREKAINEALDKAKRERQDAEKMLAEQKQAMAEARREAAELVKRNQEHLDKAREELLAKTRSEAEELVAVARRQIEDEKARAVAEVRSLAVDLAVQAAGRLVESSMDEGKQRALVTDFIKKLETEKPQA